MRLISCLIFAALCIACCLTPVSHAQVPKPLPRIAIISASNDRDAASLADLLTAAMSQDAHGYELIERAELNRIAQEAEVQAMSSTERPRALARLAKADGLLLLATEPSENGRKSISARLSSTGSGLILQTFMLAAEPKELPTAAKLGADALRFAAARTGKAGGAAPHIVSLLGIRASTSSSPGVAMEATLNSAITHHLSNTAGFGVVERWKLDDVAFERSLSEKDMPALATGTALVDGSLEVKDKSTTVKLRIRKSQADAGKILTLESPARDVTALAVAIVAKVTAESGASVSAKSWDSKGEAAAYAKLGHWLLAEGMSREAAQAYETAVALGDKNPETLFKRIYAYSTVRDPKNPKTGTISALHESFVFTRHHWQLADSLDFFPTFMHSYHRALAYADDLLASEWKPFPGSIWEKNAQPGGSLFAARVAEMGSEFLVAAHLLRMHLKNPAEVAALRARTEALANLNLKNRGNWIPEHRLIMYAGYWAATPGEAAAHWLELLRPDPKFGISEFQRRRVAVSHEFTMSGFVHVPGKTQNLPPIVDWNSADNASGEAAWQHVLKTLRDSASLGKQSDGFALAIYTGVEAGERAKLLADYLETLERNRASLATVQGQAALFSYDPKVRNLPENAGDAARFIALFEWTLENAPQIERGFFHAMLPHVEAYLAAPPGKSRLLQRNDAAKLYASLQKYIAGLAALGQPVDRKNYLHVPLLDMAAAIKNAYPDVGGGTARQATPAKSAADGIALRFVPVAKAGAPTDRRFWVYSRSTTACGDSVLVVRMGLRDSGILEIGRDLSTKEIPSPPPTLFPPSAGGISALGSRFEPTSDGFRVFSWPAAFLEYNSKSNAWSDASALLGGNRLYPLGTVGDSFYAAESGGGFTLGKVRNGEFELIAAGRRRPAEHPLDELAGARASAVFAGAKGRPCAFLGLDNHAEFHDLELRRKICSLTAGAKVTLAGKVPILEDLWVVAAIDPDSGTPYALLRRPFPKVRNTNLLDDDLPRETAWDWPKDVPADFIQGVNYVTTSHAVHGDHLFMLKCQHSLDWLALNKLTQPSLDRLTLLCYRPGHRDALEIPLTFDTGVLTAFGLGGTAASSAPLQPEFYASHLQVASAGLFFHFSDRWLPENGKQTPKPGLLHIAWKDVDDWLTRHGNAPICPDAKPGAISPSR